MEITAKKAPANMAGAGEKTITVRIVKAADPYKSALANERWSRVLKKYHERQIRDKRKRRGKA